MTTRMATIAALVATTLTGAAVPAASEGVAPLPADAVIGRWANPKETLAVQTGPCAERVQGGGQAGLCGRIVWASAGAEADARQAGVGGLVGTQLLQDYRRVGADSWSGRVYVPDMGRSFSSRIRQTSAATLSISGCLVNGFLCKSQVWHRVT